VVPLLLGGLILGALALGVRALGGDSQDELFSGQASLPVLAAETSVGALVILLAAKAIGFAVSVGAGFRGGPVFPPMFLGVAVAMIPAVLLGMSPTLALAVGAAAGMAAAVRLLSPSCSSAMPARTRSPRRCSPRRPPGSPRSPCSGRGRSMNRHEVQLVYLTAAGPAPVRGALHRGGWRRPASRRSSGCVS